MKKDEQTFSIIGAAMEVHRALRNGFLEAVYQDALALEFEARSIPFQREVLLPVFYKGKKLPSFYKADFIRYNTILIETKALVQITNIEEAQVLNYLKITKLTRAILVNFGTKSLEYKRLVLNHP